MSQPKSPDPAKLIVSVLTREKEIFPKVLDQLQTLFGPVEHQSGWLNFDFTSYYEKEMGTPLFRQMLAFEHLIEQDALADIKLATNAIEKTCQANGCRRVNLDPGYLLCSRFILATGKEYSHRIYIGGPGIYADLTLMYTKKGFRALEWTYPDYQSQEILEFLTKIRSQYATQVKRIKKDFP